MLYSSAHFITWLILLTRVQGEGPTFCVSSKPLQSPDDEEVQVPIGSGHLADLLPVGSSRYTSVLDDSYQRLSN